MILFDFPVDLENPIGIHLPSAKFEQIQGDGFARAPPGQTYYSRQIIYIRIHHSKT
jgi:hypothetical protein